MEELLTYVLTVVLGLALVWVAACIYLTIRYQDDGTPYTVYLLRAEDEETYTIVRAIERVRFPTVYLILDAMSEITTASGDRDGEQTVLMRISDKEAIAVAFAGTLERALSRKRQKASKQR